MKKIIILPLLAILISFIACSPIDDREELKGNITADQIDAIVTVETIDGKNVNKIKFECHSPINCKWSNGVVTVAANSGEMQMFITGDQTVTLTGLNSDGTTLTKEYSVRIDELYYPIAKEYEYFCGPTGEKIWRWDTEAAIPYGMGGYMASSNGDWASSDMDAIQAKADAADKSNEGKNGRLKFSLNGMKITKLNNDGSDGSESTFLFDMSRQTPNFMGNEWAIGKVYTNTSDALLLGFDHPSTEFDILRLDEDKMVLVSTESGAWAGAYFWFFEAE
ncbi:hypothetical protein [Dysgonomonas macrotermitis]|uniref:Lipocalin-like domain-containing protein n=1 Tax=Dysgonomonas macrotermitis TaxID=1346286 RepID=A0A1M4VPL3_9BACT|nr:hypothetical protein [Dysgonomonas macrotermitis]SHE70878.1 hypothetical protein SAMN05444362_1027 [Dysgonomonas macrotermitis]